MHKSLFVILLALAACSGTTKYDNTGGGTAAGSSNPTTTTATSTSGTSASTTAGTTGGTGTTVSSVDGDGEVSGVFSAQLARMVSVSAESVTLVMPEQVVEPDGGPLPLCDGHFVGDLSDPVALVMQLDVPGGIQGNTQYAFGTDGGYTLQFVLSESFESGGVLGSLSPTFVSTDAQGMMSLVDFAYDGGAFDEMSGSFTGFFALQDGGQAQVLSGDFDAFDCH